MVQMIAALAMLGLVPPSMARIGQSYAPYPVGREQSRVRVERRLSSLVRQASEGLDRLEHELDFVQGELEKLATPVTYDDPLTLNEVEGFVTRHFNSFFKSCDEFANGMAEHFEYCDSRPCFFERQTLLDLCHETEGHYQKVHDFAILPNTASIAVDPTLTDHRDIAVRATQTAFVDIPGPDGIPVLTPLCFDAVIQETLERVPESDRYPEGIAMSRWKAYYSVKFSSCFPLEEVAPTTAPDA